MSGLRDFVPSNIRLYASTMMGDRSPVTESYFPPQDIEAMRGAARNAYARQDEQLKNLNEKAKTYATLPADRVMTMGFTQDPRTNRQVLDPSRTFTAGQHVQQARDQIAKAQRNGASIGYADYPPEVADNLNDEGWARGLRDSFTNPHWRAITSIGRAQLEKAPDGNTYLVDSYDWNSHKTIRDMPFGQKARLFVESLRSPTTLGNFIGNYMAPDNAPNKRSVRINLGKM